jgi:hypothetical protein
MPPPEFAGVRRGEQVLSPHHARLPPVWPEHLYDPPRSTRCTRQRSQAEDHLRQEPSGGGGEAGQSPVGSGRRPHLRRGGIEARGVPCLLADGLGQGQRTAFNLPGLRPPRTQLHHSYAGEHLTQGHYSHARKGTLQKQDRCRSFPSHGAVRSRDAAQGAEASHRRRSRPPQRYRSRITSPTTQRRDQTADLGVGQDAPKDGSR